ncbi:hypothetical protein K0U27_05005 [archaeon]|nr:hypothetical protein [archaeon]
MKSRLLAAIGIVMLVVNSTSSAPNQVGALSCGISPFTESFNRHDLLLHGILVEKNIDRSTFGNIRDTLSTLVFETITVYKGEHQDQFTIKANLSWDDYYVEGVDYILFADKNGDHYLRDLCVPDYVAFPQMIRFLDAYPLNLAAGVGIHSLRDLVTVDDKIRQENLLNLYTDINRGNTGIVMMKGMGNNEKHSCDFEMDLKQTEELLVDTYVLSKIKDETTDYSMSVDTKLDTHPQTAVVTFDGEKLKAEIFVLNGKEFGNCFYVYNSKLINKVTWETEVNRDNLSRICHGEDAHKLIPDLCPDKISSSIPTNPDHGGGFVDPECHEGHVQVNGVCKLKLSEPLTSPHTYEELDEICKNDQTLCERIIMNGPNVLTPKNNSEDVILALLAVGVSITFILGMVYRWKRNV